MIDVLFIITLSVFFTFFYYAAFRVLPREEWQVFAVVPLHKKTGGSWQGVNITYYGILTATGYVIAFIVLVVMLIAAGVSPLFMWAFLGCVLVLFIPSAKIMAFLVEKKRFTMTVGGSVFVMFMAAPWIIAALERFPALAGKGATCHILILDSLITAYAFGEGFGRLACISFGCCYGRPVDSLPAAFRGLFSRFNFVFTGSTKKICYHDHLDGVKTVPVQAITAVLYTSSGLAGLYLFLKGHYHASFFLSLVITQLWRFASEFLRADYRGGGRISAYQVMSLFLIVYYTVYIMLKGAKYYPVPDLSAGLKFIWSPWLILILIIMWTGCLLYTGISSVTSSLIYIYVNDDKI